MRSCRSLRRLSLVSGAWHADCCSQKPRRNVSHLSHAHAAPPPAAAGERPFDAAACELLSAARRAACPPAIAGAGDALAAPMPSTPPPPLLLSVSWLLRCGADFRALLAALRGATAPDAILAFEARAPRWRSYTARIVCASNARALRLFLCIPQGLDLSWMDPSASHALSADGLDALVAASALAQRSAPLRLLDLSGVFGHLPPAAALPAVCRALGRASPSLAALSLAANGVRGPGVAALAAALAGAPALHTLNFSENAPGCDGDGVGALAAALPTLRRLGALNLAACGLRAPACARLVAAAPPTLQALNLSCNALGGAGDGDAAAAAGTCLARAMLPGGTLSRLLALDVSFNALGPRGASALGAALAAPATRLSSLNLAGNGLGAEGGAALAAGLRTNVCLTMLDVTFNALSLSPPHRGAPRGAPPAPDARGLHALLRALERNSTLACMRLDGNDTDAAGAAAMAAIAHALACNRARKAHAARGGDVSAALHACDEYAGAPAECAPPMQQMGDAAATATPCARFSAAPSAFAPGAAMGRGGSRGGTRGGSARDAARGGAAKEPIAAASAPRRVSKPRPRTPAAPKPRKETRIQRFARLVLVHIGSGVGLESDIRKVFGNTPDTSKALRLLMSQNIVVREGKGGRVSPFQYTKVREPPPGALMMAPSEAGVGGADVATGGAAAADDDMFASPPAAAAPLGAEDGSADGDEDGDAMEEEEDDLEEEAEEDATPSSGDASGDASGEADGDAVT